MAKMACIANVLLLAIILILVQVQANEFIPTSTSVQISSLIPVLSDPQFYEPDHNLLGTISKYLLMEINRCKFTWHCRDFRYELCIAKSFATWVQKNLPFHKDNDPVIPRVAWCIKCCNGAALYYGRYADCLLDCYNKHIMKKDWDPCCGADSRSSCWDLVQSS